MTKEQELVVKLVEIGNLRLPMPEYKSSTGIQ